MIIMDKSGAIKAMVGGVDYNRSQFNRAVQALRQPGSAFKTFVYLTALQYGFTPDSIINDAPLTINKWKPENYSKKYYGKVTLDYALTHSLNVATVALSRELYLRDIAENAHKMGISTPLNLTPSMVLGTNSVKLADMATAYAVLASGGKAVWPYAINEISTHDGRQLFVREADEDKTIIAASVVRKITGMLEHVINRGTGKAARLPIFAAGKTGTSQNYRDAWFVGWTNKYIAAVWVGNDNEKPMLKVGGGNLPAEIWHDVMMTTIGETTAITEADDIADLIDDVADDKPKDDEYAPVAEHKAPQTMDELLDSI
jgi:penicillin-binding protein 1A